MMTLIAAALVAAHPAAASAHPQGHMPMMHMGKAGGHEAMDCCKHCCKHEGDAGEHASHAAH